MIFFKICAEVLVPKFTRVELRLPAQESQNRFFLAFWFFEKKLQNEKLGNYVVHWYLADSDNYNISHS